MMEKFKISNLKFKIPAKQAGFTLIEVLVTLGLLVMVFGIIISASTALGRRGRDQQRVTDLQNIQAAISQFYADQKSYPDTNIAIGASLTNPTGTNTYLGVLPKDPQPNNFPYCYTPQANMGLGVCDLNPATATPSCQFFRLCAQLESAPSPSANCACGGRTYNFEVTPEKATTN